MCPHALRLLAGLRLIPVGPGLAETVAQTLRWTIRNIDWRLNNHPLVSGF